MVRCWLVAILASFAVTVLPVGLDADQPVGAESPGPVAEPIDFDRDIRPILVGRCVKCHGATDPAGGLDLTRSDGVMAAGVVVPGDPQRSSLLHRVTSTDRDEQMPPRGERLTDDQVRALRRWIAEGLSWPRHWAYRPLVAAPLPRLRAAELAGWCRTPIDVWVAHKLEAAHLTPSPAADRRDLVRRVYYDLIGLPPATEVVETFVSDPAPDAFERLVDELLQSPHYGERWARHWMDVVHFAETHGHDQDRPREHAWPYRDYLIRRLNEDVPYHRFVAEQIAGDVLYPDDPWSLVATGLLAAGPWDESSLRDIREDSLDREIARYLDRDDIVTTVMSTFTSTSVHCARCHDHKFDPISQGDYYAIQAVFAATDKANRTYDPDPDVAARRRQLQERQQSVADMRRANDPALLATELQHQVRQWEAEAKAQAVAWRTLDPTEFAASGGTQLSRLEDGSWLAGGPRPDKDVYTATARLPLASITALRLEFLVDDSLPKSGPGRQDNGNLHLSELRLFLVSPTDRSSWQRLEVARARADFNQMGWTIDHAIDGNPNTAYGIFPEVGKSHRAVLEFKEPVRGMEGGTLRVELHQLHGGGHLIGRLRLAVTDQPAPLPVAETDWPVDIAEILATDPPRRTARQQAELTAYLWDRQLERQRSQLPPPQQVYCGTNQFAADGSFRPATAPRPVQILGRGLISDPRGAAEPGALACVTGLPARFSLQHPEREATRRAALAGWVSDPRNVLTWRSIANRVWQYHFGRGLVETANDFGQMGATPTHPELLDWLALTLQQQGGSLKALHRSIVTSAVYQQASRPRLECIAIDADNRWLWRKDRSRLDAESFHDALLTVSETLDRRMGGPSVKQFIQTPGVHVTPHVDYAGFGVDDPGNLRRSVYRFVFRTIPDPLMEALDCPDASQLTPRRNVSVTAIQALATLNDKFVVRQSEHLAARIFAAAATPREQAESAFRLLFYRPPTDPEQAAVEAYLTRHGLANACRFLLNTNEFMFVD